MIATVTIALTLTVAKKDLVTLRRGGSKPAKVFVLKRWPELRQKPFNTIYLNGRSTGIVVPIS